MRPQSLQTEIMIKIKPNSFDILSNLLFNNDPTSGHVILAADIVVK
jgi:hypothetical protein